MTTTTSTTNITKVDLLLQMSYPDMIKNFNSINEDDLYTHIQTKGKSINKQLHPIMLYNYPLLINPLMDVSNNPNGVKDANIKYSPTAINHILKDSYQPKPLDESIDMLILHTNVHNKYYHENQIYDILVQNNCSNRRINEYAKVYPCLYDNPVNDADDYKQSIAYMAIEHKDVDYIKRNINYYKNMLKTHAHAHNSTSAYVDKLLTVYPNAVLDEVFDANLYTDTPLLANIDIQELAKYTKHEETMFKFWVHHGNTKHTMIDSLHLLKKAIELKVDIDAVSTDILDTYGYLILTHYPYMYYYYAENNITVLGVKPHTLYEIVLKDPYNIVYVPKDDINIKTWLVNSNNKLYDAWLAIDYLIDNDNNAVVKIANVLRNEIGLFTDKFTAVSTYPILCKFVSKNYRTPYIYNLMVQLDKDMFNIF